jgi:hypothetical protein
MSNWMRCLLHRSNNFFTNSRDAQWKTCRSALYSIKCRHACLIFNDIRRPAVCNEFNPSQDVCLDTREQALNALSEMENATNPHQTS